MTKRRTAAAVFSLVAAASLSCVLSAAPASAGDSGGNGNPYYCSNPQPVTSRPIRDNGGTQIGLVEMRWSSACGNWTRTTSYRGAMRLVSHIDPPNGQGATGDDVATQNWSPYLRVAASDPMCSSGYMYYNGGIYGTEFCSN